MRSINMVRQGTRLWGGFISNKSLFQFLSSGYLAPNINQEPDERHKFEDRSNMRAMPGEKTSGEESIKHYTKKQFFLPSRIKDWNPTQLTLAAQLIDLLTCGQNEQIFRTTFQADQVMGMKILYFLGCVFQEFAIDSSQFA